MRYLCGDGTAQTHDDASIDRARQPSDVVGRESVGLAEADYGLDRSGSLRQTNRSRVTSLATVSDDDRIPVANDTAVSIEGRRGLLGNQRLLARQPRASRNCQSIGNGSRRTDVCGLSAEIKNHRVVLSPA